RQLPQPPQQLRGIVPAEIERGQRALPDVPHQVMRSIAPETATRGQARARHVPGTVLLLIPAVAVSIAGAQLAPVPSHATTPARPADVVAVVNGAPIHASDLDAAMNTLVPLSSYHQNLK